MRQYGQMDDMLIYREWDADKEEWSEWAWVDGTSGIDSWVFDDLPQPSNPFISVADRLEGLS